MLKKHASLDPGLYEIDVDNIELAFIIGSLLIQMNRRIMMNNG